MARSAWITVALRRPKGVTRMDVVRALLRGGWAAGYVGGVERYEWTESV